MITKQTFLKYLNWGWSVIPVYFEINSKGKINKKVALKTWKEYETRLATETEIDEWVKKKPQGIGVVTGKISHIVVIDVDTKDNPLNLNSPIITKSAFSGGRHYFYKWSEEIRNKVRIKKEGRELLIDIRGDGGFIVLPPSEFQGKKYIFETETEPMYLEELPKEFKTLIKKQKNINGSNWNPEILKGVIDGKRNESATSVIGKLLQGKNPKTLNDYWPMVLGWNTQNNPPMDITELKRTFNSIAKTEAAMEKERKKTNRKPKTAEIIVALIESKEILLFHDDLKQGYISINKTGAKVLKIKSRDSKAWIRHLVFTELKQTISSEVFKEILQTLESKALIEGDLYKLSTRVAKTKKAIYYDLGEKSVEITTQGWKITSTPPILFKRLPHQKPQVQPEKNGVPQDLLEFVNLKDKNQQILFLISLATSFIPGWPHPIPVIFGSQGSAKSTLCRIFKDMVDPSVIKDLSMPRNNTQFIQTASHHWVYNLDNLSYLPDWLSDSLSRAVTGSGFSKRELFTDDEDFIYTFKRVILLNGINTVVSKPDLLDRSILFNLERITDKKREKEEDFWNRYLKAKPKILGGFFSAISEAMKVINSIKLSKIPRMADFAVWGVALAQPMGYERKDFLNAYDLSIASQHDEALENSQIGTGILNILKEKGVWEGTTTELLNELEKRAGALKLNIKSKKWPKSATWLSRAIEIIKYNLESKGVEIVKNKVKGLRTIRLRYGVDAMTLRTTYKQGVLGQ